MTFPLRGPAGFPRSQGPNVREVLSSSVPCEPYNTVKSNCIDPSLSLPKHGSQASNALWNKPIPA